MHLSHSVNRVGSQLQPELGYMHPPFLKYATKVKVSTGAGLLFLVRDGTRYPLKMVIGIVCLVTLKIGKTIPKKSTGYQIYFLIIFILRTD
jgi:hypothetical protein